MLRYLSRLILYPAAIVSVLALTACAGGQKGAPVNPIEFVTSFVKGASATVQNPVSMADVYKMKIGYSTALNGANDWRDFCWSGKAYADLMLDPIAKLLCSNRRPVLRAIEEYEPKAFAAVETFATFVRDNPTLSAAKLYAAAKTALANYQNAIPKK